jgi:small subunit ribosomal protein S5
VRAVCEAAGIKNVITKSFRTNNQVAVVKATIKALQQLRTQQEVERLRGVPLT